MGTRTFLHPVAITTAVMDHTVAAWAGAPQTIYSDHFLHTQPVDGPIGFKLEVAPLHPVFFGANLPGFGEKQADLLRHFPNANIMLALMRDGFHEQASGGKVELRSDGSPLLDYPLTDYVLEAHDAPCWPWHRCNSKRVLKGSIPVTKWVLAPAPGPQPRPTLKVCR